MAEGGYGAVLLLDTWALLTRADLAGGRGGVAAVDDGGDAGLARLATAGAWSWWPTVG